MKPGIPSNRLKLQGPEQATQPEGIDIGLIHLEQCIGKLAGFH